ncbi:MAG: hypothetical protein JRE23_01210 [Deltaproteobacteria bacterium]|nr:hypothetical protein [Deltaproteobacteria bacterium]
MTCPPPINVTPVKKLLQLRGLTQGRGSKIIVNLLPHSNHRSAGPSGPGDHWPGGGRDGCRLPAKKSILAIYSELNNKIGTMNRWCS